MWNSYAVVAPDFCRVSTGDEFYVLLLNVEQMGASSRSLDTIDTTTVTGGMLNALLQFFVHAIMKLEVPIEMWLETVMQSEEAARSNKVVDDTSVRRKIIARQYGVDTNVTELHTQVGNGESNEDDSPLLADCMHRRPLHYRLWIAVPTGADFAGKLEASLKEASELYKKYTQGATIDAENKSLAAYQRRVAAGAETTDGQQPHFELSKLLGRHEQWASINNASLMLDAAAIYLRDRSLLSEEVRREVMKLPLASKDNPVYFGTVFSAAQAFRLVDKSTDPVQSRFLAYIGTVVDYKGATVPALRFPAWSRVMAIPRDKHNMTMLNLFWPYYQRFHAQQRLLDERLRRAQRIIASAAPPVRAESQNAAIVRNAEVEGLELNPEDIQDAMSRHSVRGNMAGNNADEASERSRAMVQHASLALAQNRGQLSAAEENKLATDQYLGERGLNQQFASVDDDGDAAAIETLVLAPSRYIDPRVHAQRAAIDNALAGHVDVTTLHMISAHNDREIASIRASTDERERCIRHTMLQESAMRDYVMSCTSPLAEGMSKTACTVNAFMQRGATMRENYFRTMLFFDPELSVFGHMMARHRATADQVYHTHSVHDLQLAVEVALLDAFRVAHSIGFNVLGLGPPGEGKSRAIEHVQNASIPGSMLVAARCTAQAWSVGESHNDECEAYHETPRHWLCDPAEAPPAANGGTEKRAPGASGDDTQQHELFKTKLTSKMLRTNENKRQPDNSYKTYVRVSECMMTYVCMTNLLPDCIAAAIRSRFFMLEVASFNRADATINDKARDEQNQSTESKALRERCDWEFRWFQALTMHVEKGIFARWLTEPTLSVFTIFSPIFVRVLEQDFGIRVAIRSLIKMELIVRFLVIRRALFMLYIAPGAPRANQQIAIEHLKDLDPWLYDDSEIVFWAFEFMRSQYIDPHMAVVARALRIYLAPQLATPAPFERYRRSHSVMTTTGKRAYGSTFREQAPPAAQRPVVTSIFGGAQSMTAAQAPLDCAPPTWETAMADDPERDFSHILIRRSTDALGIELEAIIARQETVRLTRPQIARVLVQMSRQTSTDHPYLPNTSFDGTLTDESVPVLPDTKKPKVSSLILEVNRDLCLLHVSAILNLHLDPIEAVIAACTDKTMKAGAKYLRGQPHSANLPHLFGVRTIVPNKLITHVCINRSSFSPMSLVLLGQPIEYVQDEGRIELEASKRLAKKSHDKQWLKGASVNEYSARRRAEVLNIPVSMALGFSFEAMEKNIRLREQCFVPRDQQVDYPADVDVSQSQSEHAARVRDMVAGLTEVELKEHLEGRVAVVLSAFANDIKLPEVRALMADLGFDVEASESALIATAEELAVRETELQAVSEETRDRALMAMAFEAKLRSDKAQKQREKAAKRAKRHQAAEAANKPRVARSAIAELRVRVAIPEPSPPVVRRQPSPLYPEDSTASFADDSVWEAESSVYSQEDEVFVDEEYDRNAVY